MSVKVFISYTPQANGNANCGWRDYADRLSQQESDVLIRQFIDDNWYRMEFYIDGERTHIVRAVESDDPVIIALV